MASDQMALGDLDPDSDRIRLHMGAWSNNSRRCMVYRTGHTRLCIQRKGIHTRLSAIGLRSNPDRPPARLG
jgi:hypothetical protein